MSLPLLDSPFLSMQARNVAVVDGYLEELERELYSEYIRTDRTPFEPFVLVSALSQMWTFATYELLRTWRQMARELLEYAARVDAIRGASDFEEQRARIPVPRKGGFPRAPTSESFVEHIYGALRLRVESEGGYAASLQDAVGRVRPVFQRLEDLRVTLAKHEVPGTKAVGASMPGYARFDHLSGGLCWMIDLKDGTSEIISRRELADGIRHLLYPPEEEADGDPGLLEEN